MTGNNDIVEMYKVRACAETGTWIGEPTYMRNVRLSAWSKKKDTAHAHYDTYEVGQGAASVTRAIIIQFVHE